MLTKLTVLGVLLISLVGCTTVPAPAPALGGDVPAKIANAVTATDHKQLADYFAQKAVDYDAEAHRHDLMGRSYAGGQKGGNAMAGHCRTLRIKFAEAADESRAMAQEHRKMAENAAK